LSWAFACMCVCVTIHLRVHSSLIPLFHCFFSVI
jgi:hypothetical protein